MRAPISQELLFGFFRRYTREFDFVKGVCSVRTGSFLTKKDKNWTTKEAGVRSLLWQAACVFETVSRPQSPRKHHCHVSRHCYVSFAVASPRAFTLRRPLSWLSAVYCLQVRGHLFCIEDPFELSHDLGRVIGRDTLNDVRSELDRASQLLLDERPLDVLCEAYGDRPTGHALPHPSSHF